MNAISSTMHRAADLAEGARSTRAPKRLARIAGFLYLLNGIAAGFAYGVVSTNVYVAGDAAATTRNLLASAGLVRIGVVADLFQATVFVFLGMTLHRLLNHVHKGAANAMVVLVAIATGIMCLNAVFELESLRVATGAVDLGALGPAGSNALVLLLLDTQHHGFLIAQIFFGLWLLPLGYLAHQSGWFPKALGVLLVVGGLCYLVNMLTLFLVPALGQRINAFVIVPPTIAEISMVLYLLIFGVKVVLPKPA